ncbi:hypothetical protein KY358_06715 [Candidatus Woesearchaeota archaeon]|nr:hypothetical protein [Candidatus Woesearchaeota archaeon]
MFEKQKEGCLNRKDKSIKKSIDIGIINLVDNINSLDDYYTTSSCSGRILLIEKKSDKKKDARFVFAEHNEVSFDDIKKSLKTIPQGDVWLKQESVILHVCCRNLEAAIRLLGIVRSLGLKRAGIIHAEKRIIVEMIGTEFMETIIARDGAVLIRDSYLNLLVEEANKKLEKNKKKIEELYEAVSSLGL